MCIHIIEYGKKSADIGAITRSEADVAESGFPTFPKFAFIEKSLRASAFNHAPSVLWPSVRDSVRAQPTSPARAARPIKEIPPPIRTEAGS
jgi:hypothetical protein